METTPGTRGDRATVPLQRITLRYDELEDRLRLSGEGPGGEVVAMWLTRRLLDRLLPVLFGWLERQDGGAAIDGLLQEFAQQAARATLEPQAPVDAAGQAPAWLVRAIDVTPGEATLRLAFRDEARAPVGAVDFEARPLRQWLAILQAQFTRAGWSTEAWPAWMAGSVAATPQGAALH